MSSLVDFLTLLFDFVGVLRIMWFRNFGLGKERISSCPDYFGLGIFATEDTENLVR